MGILLLWQEENGQATTQFATALLSDTYSTVTQNANFKGNQMLPNGYIADGTITMQGSSQNNEIKNGQPSFTTPEYTGNQGGTIYSDRAYIQNIVLGQQQMTTIKFYTSPVFYGKNLEKNDGGRLGIFSTKWNNTQIPHIKLR